MLFQAFPYFPDNQPKLNVQYSIIIYTGDCRVIVNLHHIVEVTNAIFWHTYSNLVSLYS